MKKRKHPMFSGGFMAIAVIFLLILSNLSANAQETITVTGLVTDSLSKPLTGISVSSDGKETSTDSNGKYVLDVKKDGIIVFSAIGFVQLQIPVAGNNVINATLLESSAEIESVVVTAFGKKQKKEAIVGSVTSINAKELKVPSSNLTTAFAGRLSGVIAYQRSGEPGADDASFFIRGVTTFGNGSGSPLILIDNIELTTTDLARLQPDDIESFSILKDASATSLYGARGANGVIFVTTKEGKEGATKLNFRIENSISAPTQKIDIADPVTHMKLYTEAQLTRDPLSHILYPQNRIDKVAEGGNNPYVYPATDWFDLMFKERTSNQRSNLSVTGGGKIAQYYVAGAYNIDNGILKVDPKNNFNSNVKLNSYQLRSNVNMRLTPKTELVVRMYGIFDDYKGPIDGGTGMYQKALRSSPTLFAPFYAPDEANSASQHVLFGNYKSGSSYYLNPYAEMLRGYKEYSQSRMLAQLELNQNLFSITEGLNAKGLFSTNRYSYFDVARAYGPYFYNIGIYDKNTDKYTLNYLNEKEGPAHYEDIRPLYQNRNLSTELYGQVTLDYNRLFNEKHNFGGTLVFVMQQRLSTTENFDLQSSLPHRNIGISGRASYAYDNRYFGEFNFGYNGSERFYRDKQFGFFPTIGLAWVVSNEKFWNVSSINKLKLRGSYGLVGNDAIGRAEDRFFYLSSVNLDNAGRGATFGFDNGYTANGVSISRYPNLDITWEKSYQTNAAIELGLFNKVNLVAEAYQQRRKNILMTRSSIPSTMGLSTVTMANVGEASSKGVDLSLDYTHNFNSNFWMITRGSFTFATSEFVKYEEPEYVDRYKSHVGQSINQNWGYIAERLFIDENDVANSPRQNFGLYQAGDIKYRDVNGDGQITTLDMVPIGYPTAPEITYGFGTSIGFKNLDFSVFFQGLARESFWIDPYATAPFVNYDGNGINNGFLGENALLQAYADSHWSEESRDIYAVWPRLSTIAIANNNQSSTWFMRNGSFLRVKSVEAGYTLPQDFTNRFKITNFRIYFSGSNLFNFSKFKLWDPEMGGNGLGYPLQKVFNIGLNMNF
ncbi:SusC/RagA family TonB-linked outer membrane protein [Sphingobacterium cellulitidis]|uniref:SusC/RagA family TonB-linked outer membrane protein n=1 Tax=Sphingobacterium cellulitidis TaxID=1768011 RepID=UPI000B93FF93|nr:TonB-dependent receptor [Sphingobacterium cellulitidis]OYD46710.1 SusC/RagA family TonB-linked outer membrane protein [Sphingobacterium cellulitidis]